MPHYEVTFFKHVVSSYGHPLKAPQATISVWADNVKEAERQAMGRFAALRGIAHWNMHADLVEVTMRGTTPAGSPSTSATTGMPSDTHAKRLRQCTSRR